VALRKRAETRPEPQLATRTTCIPHSKWLKLGKMRAAACARAILRRGELLARRREAKSAKEVCSGKADGGGASWIFAPVKADLPTRLWIIFRTPVVR
jgi:hypothetical protein